MNKKREIIIRSLSNENGKNVYEDNKTDIVKNLNSENQEATSYINHFTTFAVVSRLLVDNVQLKPDTESTMWSKVNPHTKICFPMSCVEQTTEINMQTLRVTPSLVQRIRLSDDDVISDVIQVESNPLGTVFKEAVTVHLCLPNALIGKSYERDKLRLLKWTADSCDWKDITSNTPLTFSTVDVSFKTDTFCKYWLVWENIKGVVRQVYRRLTTYNVQFIAMQRKSVPTAIIAQCVREENTAARIKQLASNGYCGDDNSSTNIQQIMEGEKFRIEIHGEIKLKTHNEEDRRHLEEKVLVKRFHSQHPPDKTGFTRFSIEPTNMLNTSETKTGHISFYKLPHVVAKPGEKQIKSIDQQKTSNKRSHDEVSSEENVLSKQVLTCDESLSIHEEYLDEVQVFLEPPTKPNVPIPEFSVPLNYGELGTGMFTEARLRLLAGEFGAEWMELGVHLGIKTSEIDRIQMDYPLSVKEQIFRMLLYWSHLHRNDEDCVEKFIEALIEADRKDIADDWREIYKNGKEKYEQSVKKIKRS